MLKRNGEEVDLEERKGREGLEENVGYQSVYIYCMRGGFIKQRLTISFGSSLR